VNVNKPKTKANKKTL